MPGKGLTQGRVWTCSTASMADVSRMPDYLR